MKQQISKIRKIVNSGLFSDPRKETSAPFLMTSDAVEDGVLEATKKSKFEIIATNLSKEKEGKSVQPLLKNKVRRKIRFYQRANSLEFILVLFRNDIIIFFLIGLYDRGLG